LAPDGASSPPAKRGEVPAGGPPPGKGGKGRLGNVATGSMPGPKRMNHSGTPGLQGFRPPAAPGSGRNRPDSSEKVWYVKARGLSKGFGCRGARGGGTGPNGETRPAERREAKAPGRPSPRPARSTLGARAEGRRRRRGRTARPEPGPRAPGIIGAPPVSPRPARSQGQNPRAFSEPNSRSGARGEGHRQSRCRRARAGSGADGLPPSASKDSVTALVPLAPSRGPGRRSGFPRSAPKHKSWLSPYPAPSGRRGGGHYARP
jgi:hypothetical protein